MTYSLTIPLGSDILVEYGNGKSCRYVFKGTNANGAIFFTTDGLQVQDPLTGYIKCTVTPPMPREKPTKYAQKQKPFNMPDSYPCPDCNNTGYCRDEECNLCVGAGWIEK